MVLHLPRPELAALEPREAAIAIDLLAGLLLDALEPAPGPSAGPALIEPEQEEP
jgi:hypothetical protein